MNWLFVNLCTVSLLVLTRGFHGKSLRSIDRHKRAPFDGGFVFPGTNVQKCPAQDMACVTMDKCPQAFAEDVKQFPTICDWDGDRPIICCPSEVTSLDVRQQQITEFPQQDCAKIGATHPASGSSFLDDSGRFTDDEPSTFVAGGKSVDTYPFMAAIIRLLDGRREFVCGGTLLSRTVILTAAHCFLHMDSSSKYVVRLGSRSFEADKNASNEFAVTSVTLHPGFKHPQMYNDVALLKIKGLANYTNSERPICLMDKAEDEKSRSPLTILGWGTTSSGGGKHSRFLQEADVNVTANSQCQHTLEHLGVLHENFPSGITKKVLCAGHTNDMGRDACQEDSGGPAVVLVGGIWRQRGIVSGGIGCGITGVPGLYARVSEYTTWIKQNA